MAKAQKKKVFDVVAAVKSNSRDNVGMPKASFAITPKKDKPVRHKKDWKDVVDDLD